VIFGDFQQLNFCGFFLSWLIGCVPCGGINNFSCVCVLAVLHVSIWPCILDKPMRFVGDNFIIPVYPCPLINPPARRRDQREREREEGEKENKTIKKII
jgi:hypothetical protein